MAETQAALKDDTRKDSPPQTALIKKRPGDDALEMGFGSGESFALLQRAAGILANSSLVPEAYKGHLPNCIIALNMATRLRADPLMVMQNLYVVHGRPAWSAQFLIATINQCGRFSALRYEWKGEKGKPDWGCRAWAVEKATGEKLYGTWITWELVNAEGWVNKNGSKWRTMAEQMFTYRAGAWFVKAYAPELSMGLPTAEEVSDLTETVEVAPGVFEAAFEEELHPEPATVTQAENLAAQLKAQRASKPVQEPPAEEPEQEEEPLISKPSNTEGEDKRATLTSLFVAVAQIHGNQVATERLEMATGRRAVDKVKAEKLDAGIDELRKLQALKPRG